MNSDVSRPLDVFLRIILSSPQTLCLSAVYIPTEPLLALILRDVIIFCIFYWMDQTSGVNFAIKEFFANQTLL